MKKLILPLCWLHSLPALQLPPDATDANAPVEGRNGIATVQRRQHGWPQSARRADRPQEHPVQAQHLL